MEVLIISSISDKALERIKAVDTRLRVVDARGWFEEEIRNTWPEMTVQRYLGKKPSASKSTPRDRDRVLSTAEIILGGFPYPLDLKSRAPRLRWYHQTPSGASNLLRGDLWESEVLVTTSRGYGNTGPIAEYVLACFLHFAKGLNMAYRDQQRHRFDHRTYGSVLLQGKTVCIVGAGGIGRKVAALCVGVGMRVVGTRRRPSPDDHRLTLFTRLESSDKLYELFGESDFVAVCCQWTPETTKLIDKKAFTAMQQGTVLVNVARGEIIDEAALVEALAEDKLRGVALDVYVGEFDHEPNRRLWDDERVLITPHISSETDKSQHRGVELFCENLKSHLDGRPLKNVVDWKRGY